MSWLDYYRLLEKHSGHLEKATKEELRNATRGNPNTPFDARRLAEKKYRSEHYACEEVGAPFCTCQRV